jgi:uncharacterized protein (TIGR02996 family)
MFDREPFLRAIFDDPGNGLSRLIYADYLEERGERDWAELLRVECELTRLASAPDLPDESFLRVGELIGRKQELIPRVFPGLRSQDDWRVRSGFRACDELPVTVAELTDPMAFRVRALAEHPEWYGATRLKVTAGRISSPAALMTILTSPVTRRVTALDMSGPFEEDLSGPFDPGDGIAILAVDFELRPAITSGMVEVLARTNESRRLTELDLTDNDLDNDAALAIARSPHLYRLKQLAISRGNRLHGRVWRRLVERFGREVVECVAP